MDKIFIKHKKNLEQILRYLLVGGSSAVLEVFLFYTLTNLAKVFYLHSSIISFLIVVIFGFFAQKYFTFNDRKNDFHVQFPLFFLAVFIGLILNTLFVYIFVDRFYIYYVFAKILAIGIVLIWNFLTQKFIVFK